MGWNSKVQVRSSERNKKKGGQKPKKDFGRRAMLYIYIYPKKKKNRDKSLSNKQTTQKSVPHIYCIYIYPQIST